MRRPSFITTAEETYASLTASGRALFLFFAVLSVVATAGILYILEASVTIQAPARGGSLSEGILGTPRFINPVLAISDADRDLSALVYSGLLRATPAGDYVPDLASSYDISPDGKTYTFYLRPNATFHDGTAVTAADVVFTIQKTQDPGLQSPLRADWDGVDVAAVDEHTVRFTLKAAYAPFIENTTVGILPKHLWQGVSDEEFPFSELNTQPVGTGPYKVASIAHSQGGIPSAYTFSAFPKYALGEPYLPTLTLHFYQSESALTSALQSGEVDAASGISPANLPPIAGETIQTAPLNRVFGVFFNQNQSELLRNKDVRVALDSAIDRTDLVSSVLGGYGTPVDGPLPPGALPSEDAPALQPSVAGTDPALVARQTLIDKGWVAGPDGVLTLTTGKGSAAKVTTLQFALATADVPELRAAAEYLKEHWARMGAKVDVGVYEQGDLSQNVIRRRSYDALLFGEVVGREMDLYAFWHSSQRTDPGLNIALYANPIADAALSAMRATSDEAERTQYYRQFLAQVQKDVPAVFLYTPDFVYTVPNDLKGLTLGFIETPSDRYLSVAEWHRQVDYVWPFFKR
ncbi:MAG: peptide ABC transporter substrate-binding protein [Patescibacteria group bacterium]